MAGRVRKSRKVKRNAPYRRTMQSNMQRIKVGALKKARVAKDPMPRTLNPIMSCTVGFGIIVKGTAASKFVDYGSPTSEGVLYVPTTSDTLPAVTYNQIASLLAHQKLANGNPTLTALRLNVSKVSVWGASDTELVDSIGLIWLLENPQYPPLISRDIAGANHKAATALTPPQPHWVIGNTATSLFQIGLGSRAKPDGAQIGYVRISISYIVRDFLTARVTNAIRV